MNIRDAINEILLSLNELPLDVSDSVEDVPIAVIIDKELDIARKKVLSQGWSFNSLVVDLYPNNVGHIVVPSTYLSVDASNKEENIVVRDWKLFDKDRLSFVFEDAVKVDVIDDVQFDDITYSVANYIIQLASLKSYINIIGNTEDIAVRNRELAEARIEAIRDDANKIDGNLLSDEFISSLIDRG